MPQTIRSRTFSSLLILIAVAQLVGTAHAVPEIPGKPSDKVVALRGGVIHPVSGPPIRNGVLLMHRGRITAVGKDVEIPADAEVVDVAGKHIYPSLFDSYTNLGLVEVNAVRSTVDFAETGRVNPNVQAHLAINPDSEHIPVSRSNGVLLAMTAPSGGLISGQAAVIQLDGWTFEDLTLRAGAGMVLNWPRMAPVSDWWVESSVKDQYKARDKALKNLQETFDKAREYQRARRANPSAQGLDARWEAMLPVLDRRVPLLVRANELQEIQSAVAFAVREKVRLIIVGGYDAEECAELLKRHRVSVLITGVYRLPMRRSEPYDRPFTLPNRLREAGVPYCISCSGKFGAANIRNLPYHAAMAAAFGLPVEEALKAITLYPAQVLGVAHRVGSLDKGKDATLIITDGDPLETSTHVLDAYVRGAKVDLNNRHKRLWKKYSERVRRVKED
ncbi:MAG: amidohydrolase family protein [Pirellulaceae bacterium]|jgi:imidazolonepropionase-like amidohydrolase|nr:amidohydrolase family protein [Pirellulaceae bacterium]MDP7015853.1 amidohydrolase family protein [Pirellulaceae bacterium]